MSYLNNSDKIKIELSLSGIKKDMSKMSLADTQISRKRYESSIKTSLRQIGAVLQELPENETCTTCGREKESLCPDCDNIFC